MSILAQAEAAYERGDLDEAERLAAQAMNESRNPDTLAAFARVIGENGRRPDAAGILVAVVDQFPNDGYLRTLLGEQQVRLGQWGPGTQNFVRGLNIAQGSTAQAHTQVVVADLVAAHKAGKVSKQDAVQFINGILYNVARAPESLKVFLAASRRAVNQGRTVQEAGGEVPPDNILIPGRIDHSPPSTPRPASQRPLPPNSGQQIRKQQPQQRRRHSSVSSTDPGTRVGAGITMENVGRNDIALLMRRDRELNEEIQSSLKPLGLPMWPSSKDRPQLDQIPAMRPEILGFTPEHIKATKGFTFTEGSIDAEIVMERARLALREAASLGTARPLDLRPAEITKLEVALWDGAVEHIRKIPRLFDDEPDYNLGELAVGKFIGDVICKHYGGFWYYERDPERSFLQIAEERIDPLDVARRWFRADDKDTVSLEEPIARAAQVSDKIEAATAATDLVAGLDDRALAMKLAEQWIMFRTHPNDTQLVNVADAISPADRIGRMIVFRIAAAWAPPQAMGNNGLGLTEDGRVAIAYDRHTDEFFVLGSRKHFALFMAKAGVKLSRENLQRVADLFDRYHCPAVKCVRDSNHELGPRFEQGPRGVNFWLGARGGGRSIRWKISYDEQAPLTWKIEIAE